MSDVAQNRPVAQQNTPAPTTRLAWWVCQYDAEGRPLQQLPVDDRAAAVATVERWMKAPADKLPAHRLTVETVTNPGTQVQVHVAYERAWKRAPLAPSVPS